MNQYLKGLRFTLIYYVASAIIALVFHLIVGWDYKYAPPMSIMILVASVIIGAAWAILDVTGLLEKESRSKKLGELTVHCVVISISFLLLMAFTDAM